MSKETKERLSLMTIGKRNSLGYKHSDETKTKMSMAQRNRLHRNKGYRLSEETKRKMSMAKIGNKYKLGHRLPEETKTKIKLMKIEKNIKHPFLGKKHSEESKRKMSLSQSGRKHSEEQNKKMSIFMMGNKYSLGKGHGLTKEHKIKISLAHMGSNNPQWKGGISSVSNRVRKSFKYMEWRQKIYVRDNFTCQKCGQVGERLEAHHHKKSFSELLEEARFNLPLIPWYEAAMIYKPLWDMDNGVTWCLKCHAPTKNRKKTRQSFIQ